MLIRSTLSSCKTKTRKVVPFCKWVQPKNQTPMKAIWLGFLKKIWVISYCGIPCSDGPYKVTDFQVTVFQLFLQLFLVHAL